MHRKNHNLEEFKELMQELGAVENHPIVPPPSMQFKRDLHRRLLQQHEQHLLSYTELTRLWRFAGTAVAVLILITVISYWATVLNRPANITPASNNALPEHNTILAREVEREPTDDALMNINSPETSVIDDLQLVSEEEESTFIDLNEVKIRLVSDDASTPSDVWLISATQEARESIDAPITFDVTIGYEFVSEETMWMNLNYRVANWESKWNASIPGPAPSVGGGMSEWVPISADENQVTFTYTGDPVQMREAAGTTQPVLYVTMAYITPLNVVELAELEIQTVSPENVYKLLYVKKRTFLAYRFDLTSVEEIEYLPTIKSTGPEG